MSQMTTAIVSFCHTKITFYVLNKEHVPPQKKEERKKKEHVGSH